MIRMRRPPLQWRAGQSSGQTAHRSGTHDHDAPPSMEGRTIVRPDRSSRSAIRLLTVPFNGGPDNRPARLKRTPGGVWEPARLQWSAGQSSGQTCTPRRGLACAIRPSMEGRTIVRPDDEFDALAADRGGAFNGGPDNRPARLERSRRHRRQHHPSMEGRTIVRPDRRINHV